MGKTDQQFQEIYLTYQQDNQYRENLAQHKVMQGVHGRLPTEVDWRKRNVVSAVKDQVGMYCCSVEAGIFNTLLFIYFLSC